MKCPSCFALCTERETVCYSCRRPLGPPTPAKAPLSVRLSTVFALIGMVIFTIVYPPYNPARGIDVTRAVIAGVVGGSFGGLGFALGALLSRRSQDRQ